MPDDRPRKQRLPDNFAAFDTDPRRSGRRNPRWPINPLRAEASASAEAARFANIEAELMRGIGRKLERKE